MNHSLWGPKKWVGIEPLPALYCLLAQPEFAENVFCYVFFVCFRSGFLILASVSHSTKNNDQIKHKYFCCVPAKLAACFVFSFPVFSVFMSLIFQARHSQRLICLFHLFTLFILSYLHFSHASFLLNSFGRRSIHWTFSVKMLSRLIFVRIFDE